MRKAKGLLVGAVMLCCALSAHGAGIFRADAASTAATPDGQTWATAYPTLQAATDAAFATGGGEVWAKAGTYTATTDPVLTMKAGVALYGGFAGTETAREQRDPIVNVTAVDGEEVRRCIIGASYASLDGFTLIHGYVGTGGGMFNTGASPAVTNCIFAQNTAFEGGGMYNEDGASPVVTGCLFIHNTPTQGGGGMYNSNSSPTVTNCVFQGNTSFYTWDGGGIYNYRSSPSVTNCVFTANNVPGNGGGIYNDESSPSIMNCTFFRNTADSGGGIFSVHYSSPSVTNCILWSDTTPEIYDDSNSSTTAFSSCVQGGHAGTGNITANPLFVDAVNGSLQLREGSPCVDTGASLGAPAKDILDRARPAGTGIDMGAYEGAVATDDIVTLTIQTTPSNWGNTVPAVGVHSYGRDEKVVVTAYPRWTAFTGWTGDVTASTRRTVVTMDANRTITATFGENIVFVDKDNLSGPWDGRAWNTAYRDIQSGVDRAQADLGGEVWVKSGTYSAATDPIMAMKEGVAVYGGFAGTETTRLHRDWNANVTIIDGQNARGCAKGANDALIDGFTLTRGMANGGGGIRNDHASPTVRNCSFTLNTTTPYYSGGGMVNNASSPAVINCIFSANTAYLSGGAMENHYGAAPTVESCIFTRNTALNSGGGAVENRDSSPTLTNCVFVQNAALRTTGGGIDNYECSPTLMNCTFTRNTAAQNGGGMCGQDSTPTLTNCVFWGDMASAQPEFGGSLSSFAVTYSCVQGGFRGTGNIDADPLFVNAPGDLRLLMASPCIDIGAKTTAPVTDITGMPRPQGTGIDMGAYEYDPTYTPLVTSANATTGDTTPTWTWTSRSTVGAGYYRCGFAEGVWDLVSDAAVTSFTPPAPLTLGAHTLYVQERDGSNNWTPSGSYTVTIVADTTPPTGTVVINSGASSTMVQTVTLTLSATDGSGLGLNDMRFSNDNATWSGWEAYWTVKSWTLTPENGLKTVYVQYRDGAGNVSTDTISATITYAPDTAPPTGSIVINSGASTVYATAVTLTLSASDGTGMGVTSMRFSNDNANWGAWVSYTTSKSWTLTSGYELKTVYVQYRDAAGNVSTDTISDTITYAPDTTPPTGSILINYGGSTVYNTSVTLTLSASDGTGLGVTDMQFSNDNVTWSGWQAYWTVKLWTLTPGCELKTVYVQYRDGAGNVSTDTISDTITLAPDTTPPTGTLLINGGASTTYTTAVTLTLSASDGSGVGVTDMQFSNNNATWSGWEPYAASKSWTLTSGYQNKVVYVQYRDAAGNVSTDIIGDTITLAQDTTPPTGTIVINGGALYTNNTTVTLTLSASDGTGTGVADMQFSNDNATWSGWVPYATQKSWTLTSEYGLKTVYAQYRDAAGNVSAVTISDTITFTTDTTPPTGTVVINGGALYTNNATVTLTLSASDGTGTGVADMQFSNDNATWSGWVPYATQKSWSLTSGHGLKTVYAQYRDGVGNVSTDTISDTITFTTDMTPPTGTVVINGGAPYTNNTTVTLTLSASDGTGTGVADMQFSNDKTSWSAWEPYATSKSWLLSAESGLKTVYARYRDGAGNVSTDTISDTITLAPDTTPPTGTIAINGGAASTSSRSVTLILSALDGTGSGVTDMQFSNDNITWSSWVPYMTYKVWMLPAGGGLKTVYAHYRDAAGNVSTATIFDTITLLSDPALPTGTILINGGAASTFFQTVTLTLGAVSGSTGAAVTDMRFSNDGANWSAWEPYKSSKAWTLSAGIGLKTVYVQYRDMAGKVSTDTITSTITLVLDTTPPTGTIVINSGAQIARLQAVNLTLSATDGDGSGVTHMRFSDDGAHWTLWEPVAATRAYTLPGGDGYHTVRVQYRDGVGNVSDRLNDYIMLDATPPTGTIVINNGASSTKNPEVTLSVTWSDGTGSGVTRMRFSDNGSTWTAWESLNATKTHTLPLPPGGYQTVRVQFRDNAGNYSARLIDYIRLDVP